MAGDARAALQLATGTYNIVEGERNKVSKLKTDNYYLEENKHKLLLIIRVVEDKVKKSVANPLEQEWLKLAKDLERDLVCILKELDQKLKVGAKRKRWRVFTRLWHASGPSNLVRRTSEIKQRLKDRLKEECAQEIKKFISSVDQALTTPVIQLLDGQPMASFTARNSYKFWTLFDNQNVQVIRIHGKIGIGKSTFLKKINDSFCENNNSFCENRRGRYDMVIFVPQSSNSDVKEEVERIQNQIAERLFPTMREQWVNLPKGSELRGVLLRWALSSVNVLLLLDNLLHGVTFSSLGIPIAAPNTAPAPDEASPSQPKLCKVVFTARRKFTGSNIGATVHEIELDLLDKEVAQKMFKEKVWQHRPDSETIRRQQCTDESGETKTIEKLADDIADTCDGLPLALHKIGELFQNKSRCEEWTTEIERLGEPERAFDGDPEGQVYACLKESYDSLKDSSKKRCFLHCSLFPAGHTIEENELKCHWMVEKLLGEVKSEKKLQVYFDRAVSIIEELKQAHLLSSSSDNQYSVKLHSQFHQMARTIAETEIEGMIFRQSDGNYEELSTMAKEWRDKVKWISSMNCVENLGKIDCPNLSTLVIRHSRVTKIQADPFDSTQNLKVLDLATCILPAFQQNAFKMSNLQYLNLSHTKITSFPFDPENLSKLKFLDLSFTEKLNGISPNLLSVFVDLQLLNLFYCGPCGHSQQSQGGSNMLLVEAVKNFNHLVEVALTIRGYPAFQKLENFSKLNLVHSMVITNCDDKPEIQFIATAKKLKMLHIIHCSAQLHLPQDAITPAKCFLSLCNVEINDCWNLADLTWLKYAKALQSLKIAHCPNLTQVINPPPGTQSDQPPFVQLKNLELRDLPELCSIFSEDLPFCYLESIIVRNCGKLETIPIAENNDRIMWPDIECQNEWWENMGEDPRKSRLHRVSRP